MAVVHINVDLSTIDISSLYSYAHNSETGTSMRFYDDGMNYVQFDGIGFTYAMQVPVSGTINDVTYVESGDTLVSATVANASVPTVLGYVNTADTDGLFSYVLRDADTINGSPTNDTLPGYGGNDKLFGFAGMDTLLGHSGDDTLFGGGGNDVLKGGIGNDVLWGKLGADKLNGQNGNDILHGQAGNDVLYGIAGDDILHGERGNDREFGGAGADKILGEAGKDTLFGGDGSDTIHGGYGNDRIVGAGGSDFLRGDNGRDTFVFNALSDSKPGTIDHIADFEQGLDHIGLVPIDADPSTPTNDAFDFIGTGVFTGHAGELRYQILAGGHTIIAADVDGNKLPDLTIDLATTVHLMAGDIFGAS